MSTRAGVGAGVGARFEAIREIHTRNPRKFDIPRDAHGRDLKVSEYFGKNTFDIPTLKQKLPKPVFEQLIETIENGQHLNSEIAHAVAQAAKDWAIERGVTHFCHWFQPQTGVTAEKHDAFLTFDDQKNAIEKFSGAQLIQSEPDASSFPSGGMRSTFEARGYTAWDPSSPMFIMESVNTKTLCIPSAFISYHGDALDQKTALLRSVDVLSHKACELLNLIGEPGARRVMATLGPEQEYFLIDRAFYSLRPDLVMCGRTLLGKSPPRGQQLEDHYFGSIPARAQAFMAEAEFELFKLGVPIKTRHNEVAPSQFESAPIFEDVNVATDHNQLVMDVLKKVARRHGFEAILHEKPFAGVNGSGKHHNWSMMITSSGAKLDGTNLLDPGKTPAQSLRFLTFLVAVLKGVHKHAGLLRAGIASSGNDHRLGANEAPPAIISVFLGQQLSKILDEIETGAISAKSSEETLLRLGVNRLPAVLKDNTDRNRTSPFAFTGNKFEFRAVGATASAAFPTTLLNAAVADAIGEIIGQIQKHKTGGKPIDVAVMEVLKETIRETKAIRFEGNNYADEWVKEAAKRGLPNLRKTPEALAQLLSPSSKEMLTRLEVFSEAELVSRYHVRIERYIKELLIEAETYKYMVDTQILPACYSYHADLVAAITASKSIGVVAPQTSTLETLTRLTTMLQTKRTALDRALEKLETIGGGHGGGSDAETEKAKFLASAVSEAMADLRQPCDELEGLVADDYWPLPKYREMLFLS